MAQTIVHVFLALFSIFFFFGAVGIDFDHVFPINHYCDIIAQKCKITGYSSLFFHRWIIPIVLLVFVIIFVAIALGMLEHLSLDCLINVACPPLT